MKQLSASGSFSQVRLAASSAAWVGRVGDPRFRRWTWRRSLFVRVEGAMITLAFTSVEIQERDTVKRRSRHPSSRGYPPIWDPFCFAFRIRDLGSDKSSWRLRGITHYMISSIHMYDSLSDNESVHVLVKNGENRRSFRKYFDLVRERRS